MAGPGDELKEGLITKARIRGLRDEPIIGTFDAAHLRETHRRIFQDLPHHLPGQHRPDASGHVKNRRLDSGERYIVPYALRSEIDQRLDLVLKDISKDQALKSPDINVVAVRLATLYADLDHLHPFAEGNSRTLRTFTSQLSQEVSGRTLKWDATVQTKTSRDALYKARDFEVVQRTFPGLVAKNINDINDRLEWEAHMTLARTQRGDKLHMIIERGLGPQERDQSAILAATETRIRTILQTAKARDQSSDIEP